MVRFPRMHDPDRALSATLAAWEGVPAMLKPLKLATVRAHTGHKLTYDEACKLANPRDRYLLNMACALSIHSWSNTAEEWLRLQAALVILAHRRRATR
jgi:hypothetical protein